MQVRFLSKIHSKSLELIKWVALIFMTGDHINKYLFNGTLPLLFEVGRLSLPMFMFVLSYNLSREDALINGLYHRLKIRLFLFAAISSVPYILLSGITIKFLPLNVLFSLFLTTIVIECLDRKEYRYLFIGLILFLFGGFFVEFQWPALCLGVSLWFYFKNRNAIAAIAILASSMSLYFVNGNYWALISIPLLVLLVQIPLTMPRIRWVFYAYYPIHLMIFYLIRIPLIKEGYLFF